MHRRRLRRCADEIRRGTLAVRVLRIRLEQEGDMASCSNPSMKLSCFLLVAGADDGSVGRKNVRPTVKAL